MPMDANYKPFHPNPSKPAYRPPAGAVDAHCHVFGPEAVFPYHADRKYTPCDASKAQLFALRDFLGFDKNVIVQASCHGPDNRALVDALLNSNGKAKGVAVVEPDVSDEELKALDDAGVKGVRFNFVPRLADELPAEAYKVIAARIKPLGWHIVVYFEESEIERLTPLFNSLGVPIVIDHMGTPDMSKPVDNPKFNALKAMLAGNKNIWVKVTCPERLSKDGPPYDDFVPFARSLVEAFPDQVLWGTDWPHPNMRTHVPDDGQLVDMIPRIAPTEELQRKLLVDNPVKLYWS